MFGYMIDDTPMLFVKKAGADVTMLNGHFEQGSFTLKDWNEWGFRVTTDKLGKFYFIDFSTKLRASQGRVWDSESESNSIVNDRGIEPLWIEQITPWRDCCYTS